MNHPAWFLIGLGIVLAGIGVVWLLAPSIPGLGRLPGDISIEGERTRFYFPIATCILLSVLLSSLMWIVRFFSK